MLKMMKAATIVIYSQNVDGSKNRQLTARHGMEKWTFENKMSLIVESQPDTVDVVAFNAV